MAALAVATRKIDVAKFEAMARQGHIPAVAIEPLALVFAAMRKAQCAIGPGQLPLDAFASALPAAYVNNWLDRQRARK